MDFMPNIDKYGDFTGNFPKKLLKKYTVTNDEYV